MDKYGVLDRINISTKEMAARYNYGLLGLTDVFNNGRLFYKNSRGEMEQVTNLEFYDGSAGIQPIASLMEIKRSLQWRGGALASTVAELDALIDEMHLAWLVFRSPRVVYLPVHAAPERKDLKPYSTAGYVYVLKQVNGEHYKIGRTSNPDKRKKTFDVKIPFAVEFEILLQTEDCYTLEKSLHQQFKDKRVRGEWFNLSDDDLEAIRSISQ